MSRFNNAANNETQKTTNLASGEAYTQSPELEFVSILMTSFVQDQYYRKADDTIARLRVLMDAIDPKFAAKTAILLPTL
jgi:hypothetical protein